VDAIFSSDGREIMMCMRSKGLVKVNNFQAYAYLLTPKGIDPGPDPIDSTGDEI